MRNFMRLSVISASLLFAPQAVAEPVTIGLQPYVAMLRTIDVEIAGRPAHMLFDTGAGISSITPEFAAQIGCAPFGEITAFRMNGERVRFQRCPPMPSHIGGEHALREFAVFDLQSVLPEGLPHLDGVAGLDVFAGKTITILPNLSGLRIESRASARRTTRDLDASRARLFREASGRGLTVFAPASSPRGDLWLLLDSANLAGVRLQPWAQQSLLAGAPGQEIEMTVEGAGLWRGAPALDADLIYDGALDAEFMASHTITIDLRDGRLWWRDTDGGLEDRRPPVRTIQQPHSP